MRLTSERRQQLERELSRIRNVSYASLNMGSDGKVENVDILTDTERSPNRIVRDAEAILRKNGVTLDHRKIGVVQMVSAAELAPPKAEGVDESPSSNPQPAVLAMVQERERLRLGAVHSTTSQGVFTAEVELILGALEGAPGRAEGPANDIAACVEIVARATLEAVRNLLKPGYEIQLRATSVTEMASMSLVTVALDFGRNRQVIRLVGACHERGSLYETAVYACMSALNRPLGRAKFRQLMLFDEDLADEQLSWRAASA